MRKGKQRQRGGGSVGVPAAAAGAGPKRAKVLSAGAGASSARGVEEPTTLGGDESADLPLEFGEEIITFDSPIHAYDPTETALAMAGGSSSSSGLGQQAGGGVRKRKSVKSEASVELVGPMEVDGSVKSMAAVTFTGDFSVRDRIEAYGDIDVNGSLTCRYALSCVVTLRFLFATCLSITPIDSTLGRRKEYLLTTANTCSSKIKSFGSLQDNGSALCT
jgi:hypothetical protein